MIQAIEKELKQFNSLFFEFQYRHDLSRVFDDLLTIIVCAMGRGTQEELYFETIKSYSREELDIFTKMFGELMLIYSNSRTNNQWTDPLGSYYEFLAANHKKSAFGQFFTPAVICDFMAQITIEPGVWGKNVNEPACGSGRMVLAVNQVADGNYFVCQDLDPICCKMTAINLCFHDIRAEIHCMDSLAMSKPRFSLATNYEFWKNKTNTIFFYPST